MTESSITDLLRFTQDVIENEINLDLSKEGLPPVQFTGKMFLSRGGIVWFEFVDPEHRILNWFTGQLPHFAAEGETVVCATDETEIEDYDLRMQVEAFNNFLGNEKFNRINAAIKKEIFEYTNKHIPFEFVKLVADINGNKWFKFIITDDPSETLPFYAFEHDHGYVEIQNYLDEDEDEVYI